MTGDDRVERALRDLGQTPEGRRYAESVLTHMKERQKTMEKTSTAELRQLLASLRQLLDALEQHVDTVERDEGSDR